METMRQYAATGTGLLNDWGAVIVDHTTGLMTGDVVTLTGVTTDAANPVDRNDGIAVANAATGTATISDSYNGPFAGPVGDRPG